MSIEEYKKYDDVFYYNQHTGHICRATFLGKTRVERDRFLRYEFEYTDIADNHRYKAEVTLVKELAEKLTARRSRVLAERFGNEIISALKARLALEKQSNGE